MVEVDPTLLVAAAVTIVGIAAVAICSKPSKEAPIKKREKTESAGAPTPAPATQSKPKKKSRSRSKPKSKVDAEQSEVKSEPTSSSPAVPSNDAVNKDAGHVRFDDSGAKEEKKSSKKNKQKSSSAPINKKPVVVVQATDSDSSDSDSDEEETVSVAKIEIPKRPASPLLETIYSPPSPTSSFTQGDGWAVVEDKRKLKIKSNPVVEQPVVVTPSPVVEDIPLVAAPVIETVTSEIKVDAKKLGLLIGAKGATRTAIQNATGTTIQMPKEKDTAGTVSVTVVGTAAGVNKAITAMNELCIKGYCALLAADDFQESYVAVHPKYLSDIIGKSGSCIKALSSHTGVKITIPPTVSKTPAADGKTSKVKIGLAGPKEKVSLARSLIKDITKFFHTPVTHPNVTHCEMTVAENYFNFIIGSKGSEIKHIQNSYKVSVHIPDADSANPNVVIVGSEAAVLQAQRHIEKIIDRVNGVSDKPVATDFDPAFEDVSPVSISSEVPSEPQEPVRGSWVTDSPSKVKSTPEASSVPTNPVDEAWYTSSTTAAVDLSRVLPTTSKFSSLPIGVTAPVDSKPLASSAWNNISSLASDKW